MKGVNKKTPAGMAGVSDSGKVFLRLWSAGTVLIEQVVVTACTNILAAEVDTLEAEACPAVACAVFCIITESTLGVRECLGWNLCLKPRHALGSITVWVPAGIRIRGDFLTD